jgi:hypothetical protein
MKTRSAILLATVILIMVVSASAEAVFAQTTPQAPQVNQDHSVHHPDAKAQSKPGMGMMGQGGMMDGKDCMMESGMMASRVEGRIAELKAQLKITDAQMPQWNRFAETLRDVAKTMGEMHQDMMQSAQSNTLSDRLARREKMLTAHLASVKSLEEALQPLYANLSDEQKKIVDKVTIGPMGMM